MREALCGMHELDMYRYLLELSVFGLIALAVGLLVRRPFIGINKFVSEKIEETELL
jgi:putative membrane protein